MSKSEQKEKVIAYIDTLGYSALTKAAEEGKRPEICLPTRFDCETGTDCCRKTCTP